MKNSHHIKICYPAFSGRTKFFGQRDFEFVWEVEDTMSHHSLLEKVFAAFNGGSGEECGVFLDSQVRSLSVGDFVAIDGSWYKCEPMGWTPKTEAIKSELVAFEEQYALSFPTATVSQINEY